MLHSLGVRATLEAVKSKQAQSVCICSSQLMSSLENIRPGMRPCFLNQKMDAKEPEIDRQ
ncbi:hypothetical protein BDR07DRAFT_1305389 [Suillus spraguei]|nr:hypothetical protein BDR07DRAFT_1305389 [Suillus spraguei]